MHSSNIERHPKKILIFLMVRNMKILAKKEFSPNFCRFFWLIVEVSSSKNESLAPRNAAEPLNLGSLSPAVGPQNRGFSILFSILPPLCKFRSTPGEFFGIFTGFFAVIRFIARILP